MTKEDLINCEVGTLPTDAALTLVKFYYYVSYDLGWLDATYILNPDGLRVLQAILQDSLTFNITLSGLEDQKCNPLLCPDQFIALRDTHITIDPLDEAKANTYLDTYGRVALWTKIKGRSDPITKILIAIVNKSEEGGLDSSRWDQMFSISNDESRKKMVEEGRLGDIFSFLKTNAGSGSTI